jgi:hypothetical protein
MAIWGQSNHFLNGDVWLFMMAGKLDSEDMKLLISWCQSGWSTDENSPSAVERIDRHDVVNIAHAFNRFFTHCEFQSSKS